MSAAVGCADTSESQVLSAQKAAEYDLASWGCKGDECARPWGRTAAEAEGAADWIRHSLGIPAGDDSPYYFVQMSRANDDSPTAGRPGLDGELNLEALARSVGGAYPVTKSLEEQESHSCRRNLAKRLLERVETGWFFEHKVAMLTAEVTEGLECPTEDSPAAVAAGVLAHQIDADSSAYEVTAQTFALHIKGREVRGASIVESTSGRYADATSKIGEFCFELTAPDEPEPTNCADTEAAEDGSRHAATSRYSLSFPDGIDESSNFIDKKGTVNYAGVTLQLGAPPEDGAREEYLAHWLVRTSEFVWQRCQARLATVDGKLDLEEWFDCERLQYPPIVPVRTNIPEAKSTARIRPTTVRYRRPPTDVCGPGETVGEGDNELPVEYKFGILLRSFKVPDPEEPEKKESACLACHENRPNLDATPLLCAVPSGVDAYGDGLTRATAMNARNSQGRPMDHSFLMPLIGYLQGKRTADENWYLANHEKMNAHVHAINKWYCADASAEEQVRYSKFPGDDDDIAEKFTVREVINAYFALITNGEVGAWSAEKALEACKTLPDAAPGIE